MADQLLTLLHISDLHMGRIEPRAVTFDASMRKSWRRFKPLLGYIGHTAFALRQLRDTWWDVRNEDPGAYVVVTGDLTATGSAEQYDKIMTYLRGKLYDGMTRRLVGLELDEHRPAALIPGNHDHWPGADCHGVRLPVCMQGSETPRFHEVFEPRPPEPVRITLANGCTVVLAGLDSDAEVRPVGLVRFAARGSFVNQCDVVKRQLKTPRPDELRVLLVHHSSIHRGVPSYALRMTDPSRSALVDLVRSAGIAIVLTGHQHWPDHTPPAVNHDIVEARCGTTTGRDYFDDTHDTGGVLFHNSLLVHRLFGDDGGIVWQTQIYERRVWDDPFEVVDTVDFGRLWNRR